MFRAEIDLNPNYYVIWSDELQSSYMSSTSVHAVNLDRTIAGFNIAALPRHERTGDELRKHFSDLKGGFIRAFVR